jgi:hypothetical protein
MVGVRRYRGNRGGMSDTEYIFGRPQGRQTASHFHLILSYNENTHSLFPSFWSHLLFPRFRGSMQLHGSSRPCSIISSHLPKYHKLNVEGTWGEIFAVSPIAILMQACTQWTHSDVWSLLATMPECVFNIGDPQSEMKRRNGNGRATRKATHGIDAGRGVIRHQVTLTAQTERVHSEVAIPPGWKCFLLMFEGLQALSDILRMYTINKNTLHVWCIGYCLLSPSKSYYSTQHLSNILLFALLH